MGLFSRSRGRGATATRADRARLREWVEARRGVEAYVEPATSVTGITVLLVAHDGESTRQAVGSAKAAADVARDLRIPVYDTNRVGLPERKREYDVRMARGAKQMSGGPRSTVGGRAESPVGPTPAQRDAVQTLARVAGVEVVGDPGPEQLGRLVRQARSAAHPDRRAGDRTAWDSVESAVRTPRPALTRPTRSA